MTRRRAKTAKEIIEELAADPEYQRQEAEREARWAKREAELAEAERDLVGALHRIGVDCQSVDNLLDYAPLSRTLVNLLLDWLPRIKHDRISEMVIRALGAANEPFDGTPLVQAFEADKLEETLRWPIANTIAYARPTGINDWLIKAVQTHTYGTARQMLVIALARMVPPETSLPILVSLLDELPGHVAMALGEAGGKAEQDELRKRVDDLDGWQQKEAIKAIKRIERRLQRKGKSRRKRPPS